MSKSEIENALQNKGDFVRIDHLSRFIKENLSMDKKKFVYEMLADIYEKKGMYTSAAKLHNGIAMICIGFSEKIKHYVKEAELYIKGGFLELADNAVKNALSEATQNERDNILRSIKEFYIKQAGAYEKSMRRAQAVKIYEKLLHMDISASEKEDVKKRLIVIYEKLGKVKEYFSLKDNKSDTVNIGRR